jgi:cytochrome c-type biogenesis protein CcmH/NrfG
MNRLWLLVVGLALSAGVASAQDTLPEPLRQARALIVAGKIEDAVHAAEAYTIENRRDERGFIVLGDAWMQQMPAGRLSAARAYQEAERLAPHDPMPPFKFAAAGLWLGGDDGEAMAKQGLERVIELDPLYPEAWDDWLTLFRNTSSRRRMRERLSPFRDNAIIRSRLALLAIEDEHYTEADQLLDSALTADSTNASWLALRAQAAFEVGDTVGGWDSYHRALAHADQDSTDALWHQAIGIAWPYEVRLWVAGVPPERKQAWLESFWARRNPNLFAGLNHRVAEHFARFRYARKHYPLLHPLISYHRSLIARAMNLEPSGGERQWNMRCEIYQTLPPVHVRLPPRDPTAAYYGGNHSPPPPQGDFMAGVVGVPDPGVSSARERARTSLSPWALLTDQELAGAPWEIQKMVTPGVRQSLFAPLNLDLRSVDSVAARIGYNLVTGLDDRGVMYLRFGPPDGRAVGGKNVVDPQCGMPDVERWEYAQYGEVRFARPSAFSRGERNVPDMVFRAMNDRQFDLVQTGLTKDASSVPAPLSFGVWTTQFAGSGDQSATDVVVVSTRGAVAASLVGLHDAGPVSTDSAGSVTLSSAPGSFVVVAQARDSGRLGRMELGVTVRSFARRPSISGLLVAASWDAPNPGRTAMLQHVQRTLEFTQGTTIRSYAEVYGLRPDGGTVRYRAQYELLRTDAPARDIQLEEWPGATRLEFERMARAAPGEAVVETLDIVPAQTPPGRYLLRVRVQDLVAGADAGRGSISFAVR